MKTIVILTAMNLEYKAVQARLADTTVDMRCPTAPGQGSIRILIREGLKSIA